MSPHLAPARRATCSKEQGACCFISPYSLHLPHSSGSPKVELHACNVVLEYLLTGKTKNLDEEHNYLHII